jgi:hypothetical protein
MTLKTIIPLPVKVYEKCNDIMFTVEINKNIIIITPFQSPHNKNTVTMLQHIVLCNNEYGINLIPILFPLTFMIIKNELVCDMFYLFKTLSGNSKTDFIFNLIESINNKFGYSYNLYTDMNIVNLINVLQLHNNNENTDEIMENTLNKMFYRINRYINFCIAIMSQAHININQGSKIILIINIIKQSRILFYGNYMTVEEHIEHIINPKLLRKKRTYFYEKDGKILKVQYNDMYKDYLSAYPSRYNNHININTLIDTLITSNYRLLHNITANVLYKKKPDMVTLLEQYIFDNNVDLLYNLCFTLTHNNLLQPVNDINIYIKISYDKFVEKINKYDENVLNVLLNNYTFPISYDKRELNDNFAKLLYYCFIFHNTINFIAINSKAKQLLIMIVKFYTSIKDNKIDVIYNSKYYTDTLLYTVIKILIFNDTYKLINKCDSHILDIIKNKFMENIIVIQILNNISWKTLNKQIDYFKYLVSMKDLCKDLILMEGKLNKQYVMCMDTRLRKVIMDPLQMLNYLKTENDYYKWLCEFRNLICNIFNNMIILEDDDYMRLSRMLYIYSKIKNQSMEDKYYRKLIYHIKENNRLILFNDRINIKLKELFKNVNINLGYLARDIVNMETFTITESSEMDDITSTINKLKRKYYKYKGKYLEMKQ